MEQDELPCGGYHDEDNAVKQDIKKIVEGTVPTEVREGECCRQKQCGECKQKEGCEGCKCKQKQIEKVPVGKICKKDKCGGRAVLLHKGEAICQNCLFKNIEYKTRLVLQNSFKVTKHSNLLICFSGGLSSACLVSILVSIVKRYQKNKLFNRLGCIHIQQQAALPQGYADIFKKQTGVELNIIGIQQVMREGERSLEKVREVFKQFNNSANSVDLLTVFRDRLIADFAQKNGYDFILKGLNSETLAAESFCYFAKGLGGNLPGLCVGNEKSPFYYPLRGHSRKELQYYYYVKKVSVLAIKSEDDNIESSVSSPLDDQIQGFIDTLQQMYSHTAPAIVRTAEKIQTNITSASLCIWCNLPGAEESHLCRRCLRVWQGRKKTATLALFPLKIPE